MAGDKDKKKKRSSKKGSKDRAKSRAKPLDAEAFDRAATTLNDATAKLMRAAERHALGDVNHDGAPPDDRARWYEEGRRAGRDEAILHDAPPDADGVLDCGLIDWAAFGIQEVTASLDMCLFSGGWAVQQAHQRDLLKAFADEYAAAGGPTLDVDELKLRVSNKLEVVPSTVGSTIKVSVSQAAEGGEDAE